MTAPADTYPYELAGEEADPPEDPTPDEIAAGRAIRALERAAVEEAPQLLTAAPWRVSRSLLQLRAEANASYPRRDRTSDGTIGDAAHATRSSDHNPWVIVAGWGVVRALDLDVDGLPVAAAWEKGRALARAGRLPQVTGGGYFIVNRRITAPDFSSWRAYYGTNPHTSHGHVSNSLSVAGFDSAAAWGLFGSTPAPTPAKDATGTGTSFRAAPGNRGPRVGALQAFMNRVFPTYSRLTVDGDYGPATTRVIQEFQRRSGLAADGIVGAQTAAALVRAGFR